MQRASASESPGRSRRASSTVGRFAQLSTDRGIPHPSERTARQGVHMPFRPLPAPLPTRSRCAMPAGWACLRAACGAAISTCRSMAPGYARDAPIPRQRMTRVPLRRRRGSFAQNSCGMPAPMRPSRRPMRFCGGRRQPRSGHSPCRFGLCAVSTSRAERACSMSPSQRRIGHPEQPESPDVSSRRGSSRSRRTMVSG